MLALYCRFDANTSLLPIVHFIILSLLSAGVLVLEELQHAKARGVPILAEYLGGSFTCDAYNMTEPLPNGKGVSTCIQRYVTPLQCRHC